MKKTYISLCIVGGFLIIILAIVLLGRKSSTVADVASSTPVSTNPTDNTDVPKNPLAKYKDGTYMATGGYDSPGGKDQIGVTITLVDGVVTDASVKTIVADRESKEYQQKFISGFKSVVIGKSIDSLNLSAVSGSSLTPIGFNAAIELIKTQAKV